jgi:hypothetical protein
MSLAEYFLNNSVRSYQLCSTQGGPLRRFFRGAKHKADEELLQKIESIHQGDRMYQNVSLGPRSGGLPITAAKYAIICTGSLFLATLSPNNATETNHRVTNWRRGIEFLEKEYEEEMASLTPYGLFFHSKEQWSEVFMLRENGIHA